MAASSSASSTWQPGQPVLFGPSVKTNSSRAQSDRKKTPSMSGRIDGLPASSGFSNLASWNASHWKPGMEINLGGSDQHATKKKLAETSTKQKAKKREAKSKESESSSQSSLETYWAPARKKSDKRASVERVKKTSPQSPIHLIDDSFTSAQATLGDRSEPSTANATAGAYDSSIEVIAEKPSPLSLALRHFALAQNHLKDAITRRDEQERATMTPSTSSRTLFPPNSPPSILPKSLTSPPSRPKVTKARPQPSSRPFTTSTSSNKDDIDWDDPVISAALGDLSSSSDLPEVPYVRRQPLKETAQPSDLDKTKQKIVPNLYKGKGRERERQPFQVLKPTTATSKSNALPAKKLDASERKALAVEGKRLWREKKAENKAAKEEQAAIWKARYPPFSYDKGKWLTPKVWYFKGPTAKFVSCETRSGPGEARTMEEVAASLEGPLGFDLEWNVTGWNDNFTAKNAQGKTGLIQLGDAKNIILYQLAGSKTIPKCLLDIIEDRERVKLGVQIKGDGNKLERDFSTPKVPVRPRGLLELSDLAKYVDPARYASTGHLIALQKLVAHWLEMYLDKGETRVSNWDSPLNFMQRKYAANDTFCAVQLFRRLSGYAEAAEKSLDFSHCIHDLHHRQLEDGTWRVIGWGSREATLKTPATGEQVTAGDVKRWSAPTKVTPRQMEAWEHWHLNGKDIDEVATSMNIKSTSVASYIIKALTVDAGLPYERERLQDLAKGAYLRDEVMKELSKLLDRVHEPVEIEESDHEEA